MDLFTYLMAKNGHNTSIHEDLFSYLLGKSQGGGGKIKTATGITINIPDAKKLVSFMMTKESTQETTTGKQLFDKNNMNVFKGYIIQTAGDNRFAVNNNFTSVYIEIESGETYTISKLAGNTFRLATSENIPVQNGTLTNKVNNNTASVSSITAGANDKYLTVCCYSISDTLTEQEILDSLMIEKGSAATAYEEYTGGIPSPNPDYPQEVKTVKGYRNLFDISTANYASKCSLNNNIYTTSTLTSGDRNVVIGYTPDTKYTILPNETYYISADVKLKSGNATAINVLGFNTSISTSEITNPNFTNEFQKYKFKCTNTTSSNIVVGRILFQPYGLGTGEAVFEIKNVMISKDNIDFYVPYGNNYVNVAVNDGTNTNNYPIPLNNNEIVGIGDYKDELKVDKSGHVWLNKKTSNEKIKQIESVGTTSSGIKYARIRKFNYLVGDSFIYCTNYRVSYDASLNNAIRITDNNVVFVYDNRFDNITTALSYLENLEFYAPLKTPQLIDLNTTVDLKLFKGVNNVSNSEDGYMTIQYH